MASVLGAEESVDKRSVSFALFRKIRALLTLNPVSYVVSEFVNAFIEINISILDTLMYYSRMEKYEYGTESAVMGDIGNVA